MGRRRPSGRSCWISGDWGLLRVNNLSDFRLVVPGILLLLLFVHLLLPQGGAAEPVVDLSPLVDAAKLDPLADDIFVGCSWNRLAGTGDFVASRTSHPAWRVGLPARGLLPISG